VDLVVGNRVVQWRDQIFRFNNHLTGRGQEYGFGAPLLVNDELNGYPVIRFDGQDDALGRFGIMAGYPTKTLDRSIYMVVSYKSAGGGFTYGQLRQNRRMGLTTDGTTGNLTVIGGGAVADKTSDVQGVNQGWIVHGVDVIDDVMYHRLNNVVIDTADRVYNTEFEGQLIMGADFDLTPFTKMDVAALFVYDDVLTDEERADLHTYIENKYEISTAVIPQANDDQYEISTGDSAVLSVLDNDTDDLAVDSGSITIVSAPTGGSLQVNGGNIVYQHDGNSSSDSFQ
jgi:hypothetical protein